MKAIKYIFILLLVAIIASAVYFSLQDGSYNVTKTATIEAPRSLVYEQMSDFDNFKHWNAHFNDDQVSIEHSQPSTGSGAYYTFTDEHGSGTVTIKELEPNKSVTMELSYTHTLGSATATIKYTIIPTETGATASMNIIGNRSLIDKAFEATTGSNLEADLEKMYQTSLDNLNTHLQELMAAYTITPDGLIDYGGGFYLYISSSAKKNNLPLLQAQMTQKIKSFMSANNIDSYGAPIIIYEKIDTGLDNVIFSVGIPVRDRVITAADASILCGFQEPTQAVKVTLQGGYNYLPEAWQIAEGFITVNGLQRSDQPAFEIYKTDPFNVANPANYITEIYLPVQ